MNRSPGTRLREARRLKFKTAAEAARAMGFEPGRYRHYELDERSFDEHAPLFAARLGVALEWLMTGRGDMKRGAFTPERSKIRVNGYVGAGAKVELVQNTRLANLPEWVEMPNLASLSALVVQGNSQRPRFRDGEVILYDPSPVNPASLVGKYAVVQLLRDGDRQLKILQRGRGENRWRLDSHNEDPQEDVELFAAWRIVALLMPEAAEFSA